MYYYIYDPLLANKKNFNSVAKIETRLTDLGINGKINYLSFLKNIYQVLDEEIKKGLETLVVVGNDKTFIKIVNLVADLGLVVGFIPFGEPNLIAQLLGIPTGEAACDTLSSRIIERLDLGQINNYYFITSLECDGKDVILECDNNYFISPQTKNSRVTISNLDVYDGSIIRPEDGQFDVFIKTGNGGWFKKPGEVSRFNAKRIKITSQGSVPILLKDEERIIKTPAEVRIIPKKIKIIVGKNRQLK
ncbi:MAG: diacylglycerol kinase family protein [Patescibacteria group bacterium]